ncbi:MAG: hypothetical protein M3N28_05605 [Actinomycetota bacterium]|nr:hypothetical protein [Actinomycetota bacterium]
MTRSRVLSAVLGALILASAVAAGPAAAQAPGGDVFKGQATGTALQVQLPGQLVTVGASVAAADSQPSASGEGTGASLLANTALKSQVTGSGTDAKDERCGLPVSVAVLTAVIGCGGATEAVGGSTPSAKGAARVAGANLNLAGLNLAALVTQLGTTLCPTVGTGGGAVPPAVGGLLGGGPLGNVGNGLTTNGCNDLFAGLAAGLPNTADVTLGRSAASVVTTPDTVTAEGSSTGATISVLDPPDNLAALRSAACTAPLLAIKVGDSSAKAVVNRTTGQGTPSADPALVRVDLCLFAFDPPEVALTPDQTITLLGGTPAETTIQAASKRTFTGSFGAEAKAVELHALKGVAGGLRASLATSTAIVDSTRPQVQATPPALGDLPRTGSEMPPWTPVAAFAMLAVAVLVGRTVLKAR